MSRNEFLGELGLSPHQNYTTTEIKKAWRKKCLEHHPDKGGDAEKFHGVTHSYKMLTDASYRHGEDIRAKGPKGGLDINLTVPIKFEDSFFGREVIVTYNIVELGEDSNPLTGKEFEIVTSKIKVPTGQFAYSHKIQGKGLKKGDSQGDAYINFQAMPNAKFKMDRNGSDTVSIEAIPLDMMLRGGEIDVITMWGIRAARIPPGSREGDSIYIKNCGIREVGRHRIQLKPVYPTKEELKNNSNWKGLGINWTEEEEEPLSQQDKEFETIFINLGNSGTRSTF